MIHEHHAPAAGDDRVALPAVAPWELNPECPRCGHALHPWFLEWLLLAAGKAAHQFCYCVGDQDSKVKVPGIDLRNMQPGVAEIQTLCFGVYTEHLHVMCQRCSFRWLMACKGR